MNYRTTFRSKKYPSIHLLFGNVGFFCQLQCLRIPSGDYFGMINARCFEMSIHRQKKIICETENVAVHLQVQKFCEAFLFKPNLGARMLENK